jgi:hypothetical protein
VSASDKVGSCFSVSACDLAGDESGGRRSWVGIKSKFLKLFLGQ